MGFIEALYRDREPLATTLKKHAGIRGLLEDFYPDNAHFIYELLQNAEDAGAKQVTFELHPGMLVVEHDGTKHFDEHDVESITDIGASSKKGSLDKIGKFGVGFKSVFVYTESPHIYSKRFSFRIRDLVLPEAIDPKGIGERTRFEFPFDSKKKTPAEARSEIATGLASLSDTTLLFLSCIKRIAWTDGATTGQLQRVEHSDHHIEVMVDAAGEKARTHHWLRFSQALDDVPGHRVCLAYELSFVDGEAKLFDRKRKLAQQLRIVPATKGLVSVFFPAEKETSGLRFHLHAPFVPELSRASIKDVAANAPLFAKLAELAAASLHEIRDSGLLTAEFLAVLPNPEDPLPARYQPIRDAVIHEMRTKPLTPTHARGYAPANRLVQSRAAFKELISDADLAFLTGRSDAPTWTIGISQRNTDQDRFLAALVVSHWDADDLIEVIGKKATEPQFTWSKTIDEDFYKWLSAKTDEWHQHFYAVLYKQLADGDDFSKLGRARIVKLASGKYLPGSGAYFPSPDAVEDELFPRVAAATFTSGSKKSQQNDAKALLERLGVQEVGEQQEIERILKTRYTKEAEAPDDRVHLSDIRRFVKFIEAKPLAKDMFADYYILKRRDNVWGQPGAVYLDVPYEETLLTHYYDSFPAEERSSEALSSWYDEQRLAAKPFLAFVKAVGVTTALPVGNVECNGNPERDHLRSAPGSWWTSTGIDSDWAIERLDTFLAKPTVASARLVWQTMCALPVSCLIATFRWNRSGGSRTAASQLVHSLRRLPWVPQKDGSFVTPGAASRHQLLPGFAFDEGAPWIKALHFESDIRAREAEALVSSARRKELGFESAEELDRARQFVQLPAEDQRRILDEFSLRKSSPEAFEFPERKVGNPALRGHRVRERGGQAPEKASKEATRTVPVGYEVAKEEARTYLRDQYTNAHGVMFCQVCKDRLPFKLDDGQYHFEAVELLDELPKRFRECFVALCPNHAAMFKLANSSKAEIRSLLAGQGRELRIMLAGEGRVVSFTEVHWSDIQACLASLVSVKDESGQESRVSL